MDAHVRPGWVYLVGAGPGDPGLLTLRGAAVLAAADVVLHDELVDPAVLEHVSRTAIVRAVGKRGHDASSKDAAQQAIVAELLAHARAGRSVVRLKGGDPFFFGRGAEELEALRAAAIPFQVVPGVPSPLGAAAYAGLALTHRDHASAVTFVTALRRDGAPFDWRGLRGLDGTVCVMMGTRHLGDIARALVEQAGRSPETPAAVVQWASYPHQRTVRATLADIAARVAAAGIAPPSLLFVGSVVGLAPILSWYDSQPLFAKRVLVTRPAEQAGPTAALLRERGATPVVFPTIEIGPPPEPERVAEAVRQLDRYDLVAFTSANGVTWLWRELERQGRDARAFGRARLAAIGPATAEALRARGLYADIVAETFVAEELGRAILSALPEPAGARALLPRALVAREVLPELLGAAGMTVDVVPVYATVGASAERRASLEHTLAGIDLVMLTSSSTVEQLCALLGDGAARALAHCRLASIGPVTTRTALALGLEIAVTAEASTAAGLVAAMEACEAGRAVAPRAKK